MFYKCPECKHSVSKLVLLKKYVTCPDCGAKITVNTGVSVSAGFMGFALYGIYKAGVPAAIPTVLGIVAVIFLALVSGVALRIKSK